MRNWSTNGVSQFGVLAHSQPQTRQGFYVGIGLAAGTADVAIDSQSGSSSGGSGGNFRLGYAINPKFAVGFESNTWVRTFAIGPQIDYNHVSLSYTDFSFTNIGLGMTWHFIPR